MSSIKPVKAMAIAENTTKTVYPAPFAALVSGRVKRKIGDVFGLTNFGVNVTELAPGALSALKHHHLKQDEFVYILSGTPTLVVGDEEYPMGPGDCCGFAKGSGIGHQLVNHSAGQVVYLEVGDRSREDAVEYPDDDLVATSGADGSWRFLHKDGTPY